MSKVSMPVPVAYFYQRDFDKYKDRYPGGIPVITIDQAEAYAAAKVRGALEEAAKICWEMQSAPEFGKDDKDHWLSIAERRIRALIPPTE